MVMINQYAGSFRAVNQLSVNDRSELILPEQAVPEADFFNLNKAFELIFTPFNSEIFFVI